MVKILKILKDSIVRRRKLLGLRTLPIDTIIDIGANEGQFAKSISKVFPKANIYCFEPLPYPFKKLSKWAENHKGCKVFNYALGDREGNVELFYHLDHSPSSSLLKSTKVCEKLYPLTKKQTSISVKLTTLDKAMADISEPLIPDVLIKIDVQGYEDRVIRGGTETFSKARACILEIGLDKLYENQAEFKDILYLFNDLGFHYAGNLQQVYGDNGHVIYIDAVFMKQTV